MPTYTYEAPDGTRIEEWHPIAKSPRKITRNGVKYERVITAGMQIARVRQFDHVALSLPPWTTGAKEYITDPNHVHYGQPVVHNLRDVRNIEAASDGKRSYDYRTERSSPYRKPGT